MRTLVVAELHPWPAVDGYRQRLHHLIAGLTALGEVDVFALTRPGHPDPVDPPIAGVGEVCTVDVGDERGTRQWIGAWIKGPMPRRLLSLDWGRAADELGRFAARSKPDLVWYSHLDTWWPTRGVLGGRPSIVDFDNLENLALRLRRRIPPRFPPGAGTGERARVAARWVTSRAFDLVDERRWAALQAQCASEVDHVVVCSDLDAKRSGCPNAAVIPNGCDRPDGVRLDRGELRGATPTMLFVGALDYEPNTEAVEWFVREVLPIVVDHQPDAVVRIVGRGVESLAWTEHRAGVELIGPVEDLRTELDRADVSIVPIRVGAGTRLKVVEALAHRIPLVTTTVGCEGIDLVHGESALIADDARTFANACLLALSDGPLRQRLSEAGSTVFEASYTWDAIGSRVADLAHAAVQP